MQSTIVHEDTSAHWYDKNDPMNLELPADPNAKVKHVNRGVLHITINILLRFYGLIISVLMIAMGAFLEYQIQYNLSPYLLVVEYALMGAFFIVCGVLTLLIETRTKRTMRHCLSAYFFLGNPLSRGFFYLLVGGLTFVQKNNPPYVKGWWVGCAILGCGGLNVIYYPFYWRWRRDRDVNDGEIEQEAHPEEIIYGFDMYFKKKPTAADGKKPTELQTIKVENEKSSTTTSDEKSSTSSSASQPTRKLSSADEKSADHKKAAIGADVAVSSNDKHSHSVAVGVGATQ